MGMDTLPLTLAANEEREIGLTGEYFELRQSPNGLAMVELLDRSGGMRARLVNPLETDFVRPAGGGFETIRVTNGATPQTITIVYGSGDAGNRRSSGNVNVVGTVGVAGTVSVVDGGKSRTLANQVFGWRSFQPAGAAGTYNWCMLWNPVGSGKRLVVKSYVSNVAGSAGICTANAGWTAGAIAGGSNQTKNKLAGGVASLAAVYQLQQAGAPAGLVILGSAPQNVYVVEQEPIVIPPGFGFTMQPDNVAATSTFSAHYVEEDNV